MEHVDLGYHAGMSGPPGGSAGSGHGSDPDEEALQRRIREFLRHGTTAEAGVEEWGEFAAQLRFLREDLPLEQRQALLRRLDRMLFARRPDLQLAAEQRESVLLALEAAAAEGAAWAAREDRIPLDQAAGVAPVLRPSLWSLDWESPGDSDEDNGDHEDEMRVLKAADGVLTRASCWRIGWCSRMAADGRTRSTGRGAQAVTHPRSRAAFGPGAWTWGTGRARRDIARARWLRMLKAGDVAVCALEPRTFVQSWHADPNCCLCKLRYAAAE